MCLNKCIGDDTKAAARQSPNCIKKKQKIEYGDKRFSIWRMEFLHLAMWHVALRWHATEYAQMSAILEFYIWFRFRPYHPMQSTCHSAPVYEFLCKSNHHRQKKMMSCRFSRWQISAILDFRDLIMGSLNSPRTTSYESSIETIALNCLVFEKITFFCILATDRQTNRQTDEQMDRIDALSHSRCRGRRLNNYTFSSVCSSKKCEAQQAPAPAELEYMAWYSIFKVNRTILADGRTDRATYFVTPHNSTRPSLVIGTYRHVSYLRNKV